MIASELIHSLLVSLLITELLELPAAFLAGIRNKRDLFLIFLIDLITNPVLVMILNGIIIFTGDTPPGHLVIGLEIAVVIAEYLLFKICLRPGRIHPLVLSLLLNTISFLGGILYDKIF